MLALGCFGLAGSFIDDNVNCYLQRVASLLYSLLCTPRVSSATIFQGSCACAGKACPVYFRLTQYIQEVGKLPPGDLVKKNYYLGNTHNIFPTLILGPI